MSSKRKIKYNLMKFSEKICEKLKIPKVIFNNFEDAFKAIKDKNLVVVIDEFGYLIERDEGVLSNFQNIIDNILADTRVKLILCGSSVSLMKTRVLGKKVSYMVELQDN